MLARRALLTLLMVITLGLPRSSRADGFFLEEGLGVSTVGGSLGLHYKAGFAVSGEIGARVGNWMGGAKVDASFFRLRNPEFNRNHQQEAGLVRFGPDLRYLFPVKPNVRLYLRGGLNYNILSGVGKSDYEGQGIEVGSGLIVSTKVRALGFLFWPAFFFGVGPKVSVSMWMDAGGHYARLRNDGSGRIDVRTSTWKLGFSIGGDF